MAKKREIAYQVEFHPLAEQELTESYKWYEERAEGLGDRFIADVQHYLHKIIGTPNLYPVKKDNYREVVMKKFPFTIIYEVMEQQNLIFVSYVFHTRKNPRLKFKR